MGIAMKKLTGLEFLEKKAAEARARLSADAATVATVAISTASKVLLPFWPEASRAVPSIFLRSAIFGISDKRFTYETRTKIACVDGFEVHFLGCSLSQTDLDVWEMILHLARSKPLDEPIRFTAHEILKLLGRPTGGNAHDRLKEELARLSAAHTEITDVRAQVTYAGHFINEFIRDEKTSSYVVSISPTIARLYTCSYTLVNWQQRQALGKNGLAKWLHGHFASHAKPFAYKVSTLQALSGSRSTSIKSFRQKLKTAMSDLKDCGAISSWSIDENDCVHAEKSKK